MQLYPFCFLFLFLLSSSCQTQSNFDLVNKQGTTIETRFDPPIGFERVKKPSNSFMSYLRNLPLKEHGAQVKFYTGAIKPNNEVYSAVVDLPIGNKDLHQCADAVMRLRADYLYEQNSYDQIHFNFTNGMQVDYSKWRQGYRMSVNGNKTKWVKKADASNTKESYWNYLELIFMYAGTLSLSKELKSKPPMDMQIGDVFILGGSPGHAVIVVDMAINKSTNEKIFMLAQSYMPAQEIQVLNNPNEESLSPWYKLDGKDIVDTPEWEFFWDQLMRFE